MEPKPSIHFNPKFSTKVHINPKFLQQKLLVNPHFLQQQNEKFSLETVAPPRPPDISSMPPIPQQISSSNPIIRNTRRTLIRASGGSNNTELKPSTTTLPISKNLIKIGKNKLVTASHLIKVQQKENAIIQSKTESIIRTKKLKRKEKEPKSIYKLDRRSDPVGSTKKKIVRKYSIKRVESAAVTSMNSSKISIKSTSSTLKSPFKTRSHLSTIKRSITLLNKSVSKQRSNEICAIFRRLGKCSAFKRGRCYKIHDKKYVIICSNFLKNSCKDENCPLSHDVSLHKMPVCKYFLQGCCHKSKECQYLHKKLTDGTKICSEFLKGFCPQAEKCKLLHQFPERIISDKKKFNTVTKKTTKVKVETMKEDEEVQNRYFVDETEESSEIKIPEKMKFDSLPAYIPL